MSIPYYSAFEDRRPPEPLPYNPLREALWQFLAVVTLVIGGLVHRLALVLFAEP